MPPSQTASTQPSISNGDPLGDTTASTLVTITAAARQLSITEMEVYRIINRGHLRPVHIGRVTRLRQSDITKYVNSLSRSVFPTR